MSAIFTYYEKHIGPVGSLMEIYRGIIGSKHIYKQFNLGRYFIEYILSNDSTAEDVIIGSFVIGRAQSGTDEGVNTFVQGINTADWMIGINKRLIAIDLSAHDTLLESTYEEWGQYDLMSIYRRRGELYLNSGQMDTHRAWTNKYGGDSSESEESEDNVNAGWTP